MPSTYLQPSEYAVYGLPATTTAQQVQAACALLDGYLKRPEGLVWQPDYSGLPCYMAALTPSMTIKAAGAVAPGQNVVVALANPINPPNEWIGDVLVLDRTNATVVEACAITAIAANTITLASVSNAHAANAPMDFGLTIFEERQLPTKRSIARVSRPPIRLLSGLGRYGYGRRLDQVSGAYNEVNLLASISAFGGPPLWTPFPPSQASLSEKTNEIWIPAGILLAYFSEVRLRYLSGFSYAGLPSIVKAVTAAAVTANTAQPELVGNIKSIKAGDTAITRFTNTILDADMRMQLDTFRAKLLV